MVHGLEYLREGFFGSKFHPIYDLNYMILTIIGMLLIGLILMRFVARTVIPE
jgi:ABC-2 type transport system permease protein/capsular polysaccharide transport system permease protein